MPTYEYRCADCGQHIEVVQSFTDDPLTQCGACGGSLKKVFGSVGIVFKGSGFYKTDSRGAKSSRVAGDTSASEKTTDTAKSSDTKSESKSSDTSKSSGSSSGGGEAKSA